MVSFSVIAPFILACLSFINAAEVKRTFSFKQSPNNLNVITQKDGLPTDNLWAGYVKYTDSDETKSNFGHLFIETNNNHDNYKQTYLSGYIEGIITAER